MMPCFLFDIFQYYLLRNRLVVCGSLASVVGASLSDRMFPRMILILIHYMLGCTHKYRYKLPHHIIVGKQVIHHYRYGLRSILAPFLLPFNLYWYYSCEIVRCHRALSYSSSSYSSSYRRHTLVITEIPCSSVWRYWRCGLDTDITYHVCRRLLL